MTKNKTVLSTEDVRCILHNNVMSLMDMAKSCIKKRFDDLKLADNGLYFKDWHFVRGDFNAYSYGILSRKLDEMGYGNTPIMLAIVTRSNDTCKISLDKTKLNEQMTYSSWSLCRQNLYEKQFCGEWQLNSLIQRAERYGEVSCLDETAFSIGTQFETVEDLKEHYCAAGPDPRTGLWNCENFQKEARTIEEIISNWEPDKSVLDPKETKIQTR